MNGNRKFFTGGHRGVVLRDGYNHLNIDSSSLFTHYKLRALTVYLKERHHRTHSYSQRHRRHSKLAGRTISRVRRGAASGTRTIPRTIRSRRTSLCRRAVSRRKSSTAALQIGHNHIQCAQLLAKSVIAVPLATTPVITARRAVLPARALRRGTLSRRPQDEIDTRVQV